MITLKQLRYFCAVARHRHFGLAAQECGVSQPALSVQIQDFEAHLGAMLIERRRNAISLTETGLDVERRARAILSDAQDLVDFVRHRRTVLEGELMLGVIPSIAPYLLPAALPLIQQRYPALQLVLHEAQTRVLLRELEDGRLDAAVISLPLSEPKLVSAPLFEDAFVFVSPTSMPDREGPAQPTDLTNAPLLLLEEGHCFREQALDLCGRDALSSSRAYGAASLATIVQMVANGYGVTLLPEIAVPVETRGNPAVRLKRFDDPSPFRTIGLAWRNTSPRADDFRALVGVLSEAGTIVRDRARAASPIEPPR